MRHYPAYTHDRVLAMPWRTFLALTEEIEAHRQRQKEARFFKNPGLQDEWEENQEEWLRLQPPPADRR